MKIWDLLFRKFRGEFSYRTNFHNLRSIDVGKNTKIRMGAKIIANGKLIRLGNNCYVDYNVSYLN